MAKMLNRGLINDSVNHYHYMLAAASRCCMSMTKPTNGNEEMPWMLNAPDKVWCTFEFKPTSFEDGDDAGPKENWSCYRGEFRNVLDAKGDELAGTNEVPFWAMAEFFEIWEPVESKKGWVEASVKITKVTDNNRKAEFKAE